MSALTPRMKSGGLNSCIEERLEVLLVLLEDLSDFTNVIQC
jgi:hypothetical protein